MNEHDATEISYNNGYKAGVKDTQIKWISVYDRLPKEYGKYLICDKHGNINVRTHSDEFRYPFDISPTHPHYYMVEYWAELPTPPTEK